MSNPLADPGHGHSPAAWTTVLIMLVGLSIGTVALRIISFSFLLAGVNVISSSYFQALGHGVLALWVSIIRQLVVLLPVAWLLSFAGRLDLIWLAFPVAEMVAFALCLAFRARCRKNIL